MSPLTPQEPEEPKLRWFAQRPSPNSPGMIQVIGFQSRAEADAQVSAWQAERPSDVGVCCWEHPALFRFSPSAGASAPAPQGSPCNYVPIMSRVCERGTSGCTVKHAQAAAPASAPPEIDCPACGETVKQFASATLSLALWQHYQWSCARPRTFTASAPPEGIAALALELMVILGPIAADAAIVGATWGWNDVIAVALGAAERYKALSKERDELQRSLKHWQHCHDVTADMLAAFQRREAALREQCICAAIRLPSGEVWRGHRHDSAMLTASKAPDVTKEQIATSEQGFITSRNRFVSREEGARIQRAAGIVSAATLQPVGDMLFSEDLYLRDWRAALASPDPEKEPQ